MVPLELRVELAPDPPIGVAEMVVDDGIAGLELDGALQQLHRLVVMAELVMRPAEQIDDIAVLGCNSTARRSILNASSR